MHKREGEVWVNKQGYEVKIYNYKNYITRECNVVLTNYVVLDGRKK